MACMKADSAKRVDVICELVKIRYAFSQQRFPQWRGLPVTDLHQYIAWPCGFDQLHATNICCCAGEYDDINFVPFLGPHRIGAK